MSAIAGPTSVCVESNKSTSLTPSIPSILNRRKNRPV
jgi:hypothetical protein